jgi:PleD family two-component response regulator
MSKILSIADQRGSLDLARTLLGRDGHDLIEATDALAGLHRAIEDAPECIVVELDLVGFDGLVLCQLLCSDAATRRIPVVVWGTLGAGHAAQRAKQAGAFAYVDRASAPGALTGSVRRALADAHRNEGSAVRMCIPARPEVQRR